MQTYVSGRTWKRVSFDIRSDGVGRDDGISGSQEYACPALCGNACHSG